MVYGPMSADQEFAVSGLCLYLQLEYLSLKKPKPSFGHGVDGIVPVVCPVTAPVTKKSGGDSVIGKK